MYGALITCHLGKIRIFPTFVNINLSKFFYWDLMCLGPRTLHAGLCKEKAMKTHRLDETRGCNILWNLWTLVAVWWTREGCLLSNGLDYLKELLLRNTSQTQLWIRLCKELEVTPNWVDQQHTGRVYTASLIFITYMKLISKDDTFIEFLGLLS